MILEVIPKFKRERIKDCKKQKKGQKINQNAGKYSENILPALKLVRNMVQKSIVKQVI